MAIASISLSQSRKQQEWIMSDLIYVGLAVFLFLAVGAYARACARL
jgi:hypothetical protein